MQVTINDMKSMQVTEVNASNHQRLKSMQVMPVTSTLEVNASNIIIRSQCK